jgi:putative peptide zinc metalloprotease protein
MADLALGGAVPTAGEAPEAKAEAEDFALPPLRDDLQLMPAAPERSGVPGWTIHDPTRNRYFRIGPLAFECLLRWQLGSAEKLAAAVRAQTVMDPELEDIARLVQFLQANGLIARQDAEVASSFTRIAAAGRKGWLSQATHGYLFFRIPLVRPTRFLRATQPIADAVAAKPVQRAILILGLIGLYLVSRQWEAFTATFVSYLSWQGAAVLAVTLIAAKILHELGHAYSMTRHGGRVPTMGVAFLVLYPVLYTDTSDAWRLTSRRARLAIGTAGIRVELAVALLATFLWAFLPDGPVRGVVFMLATVTWVTTLLINLNPFLRFDGYYILSDWLDIPNLQPRAFALTRWWLRETLFGFRLPPPEVFAAGTQRLLIAYGLATWIYRFFLFLGIALLVYHLFFKAAGIILFAVEIAYFIVLPIVKEVAQWPKLGRKARPGWNALVTLAVLGGLVWLFVTPWSAEVSAPALLESRSETVIETAIAGRLAAVEAGPDGTPVTAGTVLFRLASPSLDAALARNAALLRAAELQQAQAQLRDRRRGQVARLTEEIRRLESEAARIRARMARLEIRAPADGLLRDVPPGLREGLWLGEGTRLGRVLAADWRVAGYVDQADLPRVAQGAAARFIPEDPARPAVDLRVTVVDGLGTETLRTPHLASQHGGGIAAARDPQTDALEPVAAVYRIEAEADPETAAADAGLSRLSDRGHPLRGTLIVEAPPESYAARTWRVIGAVLLRESGF